MQNGRDFDFRGKCIWKEEFAFFSLVWFGLVSAFLAAELRFNCPGAGSHVSNFHYYSEGICRVFRMQISHDETVFLRLHVCVEDNLVILLKKRDIVSVIFELIKTH